MDINTKQDRRRYVECIDCGHPYGFDRVTNKCTIVSCINYFGAPPAPRPPSTREVVAAERRVLFAAAEWARAYHKAEVVAGYRYSRDAYNERLNLDKAVQALRSLNEASNGR